MENKIITVIDLCCSENIKPELNEVLKSSKNGLKWEEIIKVCIENSVLPSVYLNLEKNYKELVPESIFKKMKQLYKQVSLSNVNKVKELIKISKSFSDENIDNLAFKGPTLAAIAYGNISNRQYRDIDIFISENNFEKARQILIHLGYKPQFRIHSSYKKIYLRSWNYLNFYSKNGTSSIDLHWRSANSHFSFSMDFNHLNKKPLEVEIYNQRIKTLSVENNLINLCQHGCKHGWKKLVWILDIHKYIENSDSINWEVIFTESDKLKCTNMLKTGLLISNILFNTNLPDSIKKMIHAEKKIKRLVLKRVNSIIENRHEKKIIFLPSEDYFYINTMQTLKDKILHFISFFMPTTLDWKLGLPTSLYFIYYFYRPLRVIKRKYLNK